MSDDLVKTLRNGVVLIPKEEFDGRGDYWTDNEATDVIMNESANYIEKLEAQLAAADELAQECERIAPIVGESIEARGLGNSHGIATANTFRARILAYRDARK
jgi:hypothetical protein